MKLQLLVTGMLVCALTACTTGASDDVPDSGTAEGVSAPTPSPDTESSGTAAATEPPRQLRGRAVAAISGGPPGPIALDGDTVAFPVAESSVVYLGPNALGLTGHTTGGDCWQLPIDGGLPRSLTHTALAMGCAASDDTLIWTQHLPGDDPRNATIGEQPFTTWTLDLTSPDASPTRVGISMAASGNRLAVAQRTGRDWTVVLHEAP